MTRLNRSIGSVRTRECYRYHISGSYDSCILHVAIALHTEDVAPSARASRWQLGSLSNGIETEYARDIMPGQAVRSRMLRAKDS
jgi:hypothetical protein